MIAVEVSFQCPLPPDESQLSALASLREVYGVRRLDLDLPARRMRIEYDASRLSGPTLRALLRRTGLELREL